MHAIAANTTAKWLHVSTPSPRAMGTHTPDTTKGDAVAIQAVANT